MRSKYSLSRESVQSRDLVDVGRQKKSMDVRDKRLSLTDASLLKDENKFASRKQEQGDDCPPLKSKTSGTHNKVRSARRERRVTEDLFDDSLPVDTRRKITLKGKPKKRLATDSSSVSSLDSSDSSSSDSDSDDSQQERTRRTKRQSSKLDLYRVLEKINRPKDVVKPGIFNCKEGDSLKRFLSEYEEYFVARFDGTEHQKSKQLEQFLSGRARQAFDAMGGPEMKYSKMKPKLLAWYKTEGSGSRRHSEAEFERAKMLSGDTLMIYVLRLERLAREAFTESKKNQERQLCKKIWSSAPQSFYKVLAEGERGKGLMRQGKKLDFKDILRLAEAEDRQRKYDRNIHADTIQEVEDNSIWYSRPETQYGYSPDQQRSPSVTHYDTAAGYGRGSYRNVYVNSNYKQPSDQNRRASPPPDFNTVRMPANARPSQYPRNSMVCNWCGRCGHLENMCCLKSGACLICGSSKHTKENCDTVCEVKGGFSPKCSLCRGTHLGKNCPTKNPLN